TAPRRQAIQQRGRRSGRDGQPIVMRTTAPRTGRLILQGAQIMEHRRTRGIAGFSAILAVVAAGGLRAEDPSAETVLKGLGLKRVGATYVLGSAEADTQTKVNELKLLSRQLNLAVRQQEAAELGTQNREAMIQEMLQQRLVLNEQIAALDQEINGGG